MTYDEILLKSASGVKINPYGSNLYDSSGNVLTVTSVTLDEDGWTTWKLSGDLYRLGEYTIYNCDAEKILLPDRLEIIDGYAFRGIDTLTTISIPNSVKTIKQFAFIGGDAPQLTTLFIGSGIETIENQAFEDFPNLNSITITAPNVPAVSSYSFSYVATTGTLYAPNGDYESWTTGRYLLSGWTFVNEGTADPDAPEEPMDYFIKYTTTDGRRIELPYMNQGYYGGAKITANGYYGTYGKIGFDSAPTQTGMRLFYQCENLKSVELPDSITFCEIQSFVDCPNLTDIHFGANFQEVAASNYITSTGYDNQDYAFVRVPNLTNITMTNDGNSYMYVKDNCLYRIENSTNRLVLGGKDVTSISETPCYISYYAFADRNVRNMTLEKAYIDVSYYAFAGSAIEKLTVINETDWRTDLSPYSFYKCQNFQEIDIRLSGARLQVSENTFKGVKTGGTVYHNDNLGNYLMSTDPYYLGYYGWNAVGDSDLLEFVDFPQCMNKWDVYNFSILCKDDDVLTYTYDATELIFNAVSEVSNGDGSKTVNCTLQVNPEYPNYNSYFSYANFDFSVSNGITTVAKTIQVIDRTNLFGRFYRGGTTRFELIYTITPTVTVPDGISAVILETGPHLEFDGLYHGRTVAIGEISIPADYSEERMTVRVVSSQGESTYALNEYIWDKYMTFDFPTRVELGVEYDYSITTYDNLSCVLNPLALGSTNIITNTDNGNGSRTVTGKYTLLSHDDGTHMTGGAYELEVVVTRSDGYDVGTRIYFLAPFENPDLMVSIPSQIDEGTDTPISITYLEGRELNFSTPEGVVIEIDEYRNNGDGTITAVGTIRVDEENTQSVIRVVVTDGVETITKTITILDKDEPMATPTISINPYADLSFPQEGGTKYITITYGNTTSQFINTPYSTEFGVTIAQQSVTETDTGVQIYYAISVPRTTYKRNIPLIFSCSNAQGTSTTATFTAVQAGETPGTEGAYINLDYTMHMFPASGGTFYVQANFGFPGTSGLSVRVSNTNGVYPITWCHAELMGGGVSDDGTEGEEIWKITMDDGTDMTEPFSARIRFSYTNSYGESASAEFIAIREAGDTDVPESSLSLYRTIMRFDANGVFDMGEAVCKADYRWTNEEDIDEPVVVGDWIAITEGTHQTGSNYIIIPWQISVSHNASNTSRTGSVTFSSIGQDDLEHTMVLTVIQAGVEESDEKPEYVDLLWKDCEVVLDDDDVTFRILDEYYDEFYTGRCQKRPDGDSNWFFINKIVQDYVYMEEIPDLLNGTTNYQEHQNGYRHFRLDTPDTVGAMKGYYFKYDWSYTEDSPFILSESIIPYVVEGQKNLVTYCNLSYSNPQTDTITWITPNGAVNTGFQAQAEEYATKVVTMASNADYYVLGGQRYEVISPCRAKYVLYYLSPKGGWCWFPIMGKVNASDKLTTFTLTKNYDNTKMQFGKTRYTVDISTDYELSTGFLTESQSLRMWEVLESNMCYLHDMEKDVIFPVLMKQDTVEKKKYQRGQQKMLSYNFTVETSQGRMRM